MNKKFLPAVVGIMLITVLASGCGKNTAASPSPSASAPAASGTVSPDPGTTTSPSPETSPSADTQKPILDAFEVLLKTPGNEKAALAAMMQDISKLTPENANQMLLSFEAYQSKAITDLSVLSDDLIGLIQKSDEPYNEKSLNDLSKISNADLKNALQAVFDRGYKIIIPEGMYEAVINYGVYKTAEKNVTPDIAAYIELMAAESESRMSEDAAIIIPIHEVFARALAAESFVVTYHDSIKFDQVEQKYMNYVDTYFFGQNNTPAFDYVTKKLDQEFLDSYQKAAASGKDSAIVKAAAEYLKILEDNGYKLTDAVTDYRKSMTNSLKNTAS